MRWKSWCETRACAAISAHLLSEGYDLERLAARVATARATPRDLAALARTLALLPKVKARLTARRSARLTQLEAAIELCPEVQVGHRGRPDRRPAAGRQRGRTHSTWLPRRARSPAVGLQGWQELDCPLSGRADPTYRHPGPEGRFQPGFWLLHRDHSCPGPAGRDSLGLHSQADGQERRAVLHP